MPNAPLRSSYEPGHHRRMLMIVDESPESETALYFCASRIAHTSGSIVLLFIIEPLPNLMGVGNVHVDEQTNRAKALFRLARNKLNMAGYQHVVTHEVIRQGKTSEAIVKAIQETSTSASWCWAPPSTNGALAHSSWRWRQRLPATSRFRSRSCLAASALTS